MPLRRQDILDREAEIREAISTRCGKSYLCSLLGCSNNTLTRYLRRMGIDYTNTEVHKPDNKYVPATAYLNNCKRIASHALKLKLIKDGIKQHMCEGCGITMWRGRPTPIELHHVNGIHSDNRLENLALLCPNCHALEPNYRGAASSRVKIKEKVAKVRAQRVYLCACGNVKTRNANQCLMCKKTSGRKVQRPDKDDLLQQIRNSPMVAVAAKYGVSDNTVRKWCKWYGLPAKKVDIAAYE